MNRCLFLIFVGSLLLISEAAACVGMAGRSMVDLVSETDHIYLAQLTTVTDDTVDGTVTLEFEIKEHLKGNGNSTISIQYWKENSWPVERPLDHSLNNHVFWEEYLGTSAGGLDCVSYPKVEFGSHYVVFAGQRDSRAVEPITGTQDEWYLALKAHLQDRDKFLSIGEYLRGKSLIYLGSCTRSSGKAEYRVNRVLVGKEEPSEWPRFFSCPRYGGRFFAYKNHDRGRHFAILIEDNGMVSTKAFRHDLVAPTNALHIDDLVALIDG